MNTSKQPKPGDIVLRKGKRYIVGITADGTLTRQEMHISGSGRVYGTAYKLWKDGSFRILQKKDVVVVEDPNILSAETE